MTEKIRYGVLSTAQIARNAHIPAAREAAFSEIVAISSRDGDRARYWAEELGVPRSYASYDEVLADPEVDAVINPLPNCMHCEWTIRAAEAGKHILCEKPLAVTVDEARRMVAAAEANGVILMEGFTPHFAPLLPAMREVAHSGEIGDIILVRAELTYTIPDWENDTRIKPDLAGGALLDAGCYCVNAIRALMGAEPVSVSALSRVREGSAVDTTFAGLMRFPGDRIAYMITGMEQPYRWPCEVVGTGGTVSTGNVFAGTRLAVKTGPDERIVTFEPVNRFMAQLDHVSQCILEGRSPRISTADSIANTAVLVALREAAESGEVVHL